MHEELFHIRRQFTAMVVVTFLLTPILGLWAAVIFGLVKWSEIAFVLDQGGLVLFLCAMLAWVAVHFWHLLDPVCDWLARAPGHNGGAERLHQCTVRFSRDYWGLFLIYAFVTPAIYFVSGGRDIFESDTTFLISFAAQQLALAVLIGLPAYLLILDKLGRLVSFVGLSGVHHGLKSKIMRLGGYVPLLSYSIMLEYYWLRTGYLSGQTLLMWATLGLITLFIAILSVRSLTQSLRPVQEALHRSGATTHEDLAGLRPQSTDEIGYLTQTLGRLFQRLTDQESHMHAVVDNAAEGIIVTDEQGLIDTFNIAAETLFGYRSQEVRGRPLSRLLPALTHHDGTPRVAGGEQETEGVHHDGGRVPMSARVSKLRLSGKPTYTCLVADISARKAAQEKQRKAEGRYRDLVETAHDLVWSMNPQGNWTYLNSAALNIYGYAPHEMIHRPIHDFRAPEYADQEQKAFAQVLEGRELYQFETVHLDRNGLQRHLSFNAKAQVDSEGSAMRITGTARDITEKKAFEQQLTYQAEHDVLTGLYNRRYFQQELERVVARVARSAGSCGLLYIDLDQFKYINDTRGHAAGDRLLVDIANLLSAHVREGELLARFGGDEFTVLLYNIDTHNILHAAENFRNVFEAYKFLEGGKSFNVTCSIGAAVLDSHADNADEILSRADLACNTAKSRGRNRVNLYDPDQGDQDGMAEDMGWAARVREMLDSDRFLMVFQPIVAIDGGVIHDFEVLMRMPCDDGQVILPGGFLPAAERFGLIHSLDRWMVSRAIRHLAELHAQGREVRFAINLSGHAFEDDALLPLIRETLQQSALDPSLLTFEITETAAITNLSAATRFISSLKDIGCQFALDDFGSGFCSFTYLKHLPVDKLKIDGAFVKGLAHSQVDQAMVQSMNQIAHALGKITIAECVEDARALHLLREFGVDYAQGNHLGGPSAQLPGDDRVSMLLDPALA